MATTSLCVLCLLRTSCSGGRDQGIDAPGDPSPEPEPDLVLEPEVPDVADVPDGDAGDPAEDIVETRDPEPEPEPDPCQILLYKLVGEAPTYQNRAALNLESSDVYTRISEWGAEGYVLTAASQYGATRHSIFGVKPAGSTQTTSIRAALSLEASDVYTRRTEWGAEGYVLTAASMAQVTRHSIFGVKPTGSTQTYEIRVGLNLEASDVYTRISEWGAEGYVLTAAAQVEASRYSIFAARPTGSTCTYSIRSMLSRESSDIYSRMSEWDAAGYVILGASSHVASRHSIFGVKPTDLTHIHDNVSALHIENVDVYDRTSAWGSTGYMLLAAAQSDASRHSIFAVSR